jgi:hypothetical protein
VNLIESWEAQSNQWTEWARSPGLLPPAARQYALVAVKAAKPELRMTLLPMKKAASGNACHSFCTCAHVDHNLEFYTNCRHAPVTHGTGQCAGSARIAGPNGPGAR